MPRYLSPGDLLSDAIGLGDDENRMILRMFINTLVWGAVGTALVIGLFA